MEKYRVPLGVTYTKIKDKVTPFEHLLIDPLMPITTASWIRIGSKKAVTLYHLLVKCINTGCIDLSVMEENMTRCIQLTLFSLEARFGIKISLLSSDAGTNLLKDNLKPTMKTE